MAVITCVNYHYVRNIETGRYPRIKGLEYTYFKEQLDFFQRYYNIISPFEFINIINGEQESPNKALLLTFDDGYMDHYQCVFPELVKRKLSGIFFSPVESIFNVKLLAVNKIHFLLASVSDLSQMISEIQDFLFTNKSILKSYEHYYDLALAENSRYDKPEVILIKRLLQYRLPENMRIELLDRLFNKYVDVNESVLASELYMNLDQLKLMQNNGMLIGAHGVDHIRLGKASEKQQKYELLESYNFLVDNIGVNSEYVTISYPYGSYTQATIELAKNYGYKAAFTTEVDTWKCKNENRYIIPRLDTNDFPKSGSAFPNSWYDKA